MIVTCDGVGVVRHKYRLCDHLPAFPDATVELARDHIVHEAAPEAVAALEALLPTRP